jgi:glycine oxidase
VQKIDYLIIGQGLAGSCLALEFLKRGFSFLMIDKVQPNSASRVAAGLFNPITGKTMEATWRAKEIFSSLPALYLKAEELTGQKFLHQLPIYRPFLSTDEHKKWKQNPNEFVKTVYTDSQYSEYIRDVHGGLELNHCGFLDAGSFLSAVRQLLRKKQCLIEEDFLFDEYDPESDSYQNLKIKKVIFCDGVAANHNPFLKWLPIRKLKGETLRLETELPRNIVFNRGVFAVPMPEESRFLIGSTYSHDTQPGNTETGLAELANKARALFKNDFIILDKNWGHRPTTPDRRPILGRHPTHQNVYIFNGLGTKGVSLAPFFALHFANWLEGKTELDSAVNIQRFYSLFYKVSGT